MQPAAPRDRLFLVACAAAAALFAAAYANSFENGFHFDDSHVIERNLFLRDLSNLPRFFTDARTFSSYTQNATYRPLVSVTLAVDYAVAGGLHPPAFHLTHLLLFFGVGALLFAVSRSVLARTGDAPWHKWAALFAATFFCVHTANTQPGNYLSARSELLCALGVLGAFAVYLGAPNLRRYGVYLLPMALGALGKTPAVLFAPLLLVYKLLFEAGFAFAALRTREGRRASVRAAFESAPAFAAAVALFLFVEGMNPPGQTYGGGDRLQYLWTQSFVWVRYVGLFFVPLGLSADTDLTLLPSPVDARVFAGAGLLLASVAAAAWATRRAEDRPIAFGLAWFWLGLLPTSSVVPLAEVTNDHRMFLGYLGASLALATFAFPRLWSSAPRALAAGAVAVLVAHAVGTHVRNRVWRDEETLWADVVEKSPLNGRGWMNYGLTQMQKGRLAEAKRLFEHARTLTPHYPTLEVNLGVVNGALGHHDLAEAHFRRAQTLAPSYAAAWVYYARFLANAGRAPEALGHLERALSLEPADVDARHLLLDLLAARGEPQSLRRAAEDTLAHGADPVASAHLLNLPPFAAARDDAAGWYDAGLQLTGAGQHARAAQAYRAAVRHDPSHAEAWNNLGWSLQSLGFRVEAEAAYRRALAVRPDFALAQNNLAALQSAAARQVAGGGAP